MSVVDLDVDVLSDGTALELLPAIVIEISEIIGLKNTLKLSSAIGGIEVWMPDRHDDNRYTQMIADAVGDDAMRQLLKYYERERVYIPRCKDALLEIRNIHFVSDVRCAVENGVSQTAAIQQLSVEYGFSQRNAYKILASRSKSSAQTDLF